MARYQERAFCPKCGFNDEAPFGETFFLTGRYSVCPKCGNPVYNRYSIFAGFEVRTVRWSSTSVWWKPSSWFSGYWVDEDGQRVIYPEPIEEQP